jgi:hypothetical protein
VNKLSQGVPAQGTTHPPCPEWCEDHWDSDEDVRQGVETSIYRLHSYERRMPYRCVDEWPGSRHQVHEVVVSVLRYDSDHAVGETEIEIGSLCSEQALSIDEAEGLALILQQAVLVARTGRPERNADEIDVRSGVDRRKVRVADTGCTPTAPPT